MRLFAFGGTDSAPAFEGVHRLYQFALRDQREGAALILVAVIGVIFAALRRRIGPYEIGFVASIAILLVVMRDGGAYENHLIDLLVLTRRCGRHVAGGAEQDGAGSFSSRWSSSQSSPRPCSPVGTRSCPICGPPRT